MIELTEILQRKIRGFSLASRQLSLQLLFIFSNTISCQEVSQLLLRKGRIAFDDGVGLQTFFEKVQRFFDLGENLCFLISAEIGAIFDDSPAGNGGSYGLLKLRRVVAWPF